MSQNSKWSSDDMEPGSKLSPARDMEPSPKLDSAQFFYQNPVLDYALSNCGQLLTDAKLRPSGMEMDPKLDSCDIATSAKLRALDLEESSKLSPRDIATNPKLDSLYFFIESN